jgi:vitamin K-dependent gamma-carboxylase
MSAPVDLASLAMYRILFGAMGVLGALRFFWYGWIDQLYIQPKIYFPYWLMKWVHPWPAPWMQLHFVAMAIAAFLVCIGLYTRASAIVYFLLFTYVELIDRTTYLNHYYFISLMALVLACLPVGELWSADVWRRGARFERVPAWMVWLVRGQVGVVYLGAALAKVGHDWLVCGEPLGIWLSARSHWAVVGWLFEAPGVGLAMSWGGFLFDLCVVPALLWRRTRVGAYAAVVGFHLVTWLLFPIGVFPWLMMASALIFFDPDWPRRARDGRASSSARMVMTPRWMALCAACWMAVQVALPLRSWLYPGDVHWSEQGFRFSWRVMLVEKAGDVTFRVEEPRSGKRWEVYPSAELTPLQEKMMATQPDMILSYAHHLRERFEARGVVAPRVYADAWVSWDGRAAARLIDPGVDLGAEAEGLGAKRWIMDAPAGACGEGAR